MSNPKVWNPNLTFNAVPGSLALDTLDLYVSQSINGVTGGTSSPVSPIIIGGAGLEVSSTLTIPSAGTLTVASGGTLAVVGSLAVTGTLTISGAVEFASPRTYTRSTKGTIWFDATEWGAGTNGMFFVQTTPPGSGGIQTPVSWVLDVPAGSTITGISWRIDPAGGHGALPGTLPSLLVRELNPADGSSTNVVTLTDTSPDVPTYQAAHTLTSGVLSFTTTAGRIVVASMLGEKGANEVAGGSFYPPQVTFTRTSASEA